MVILSVDYGDARTGIAICDSTEILATPVCVIKQTNKKKLIEAISLLAKEREAELIVVGYPKNMDSSLGERAEKTLAFAEKLKRVSGLTVELWDERLTTEKKKKNLNAAAVKSDKKKEIIDSAAAVIILQDFIDYRRMNK